MPPKILRATDALRPVPPHRSASSFFLVLFHRRSPGTLMDGKVAERAFRASYDPGVGFARITEILRNDPELTREMRRRANSRRFGRENGSMGTQTSVIRVGIEGVRETLMQVAACRRLEVAGQPLLTRRLQERARMVGWCCVDLAALRGEGRTDAFAAGLLHDVGRATAWQLATEFSDEVVAAFGNDVESLRRAVEGARADLGSEVALRWGLGGRIAAAIRWHCEPERSGPAAPLAWIVSAAITLCDELWRARRGEGSGAPGAWLSGALGLTPRQVDWLVERLLGEMPETAGAP